STLPVQPYIIGTAFFADCPNSPTSGRTRAVIKVQDGCNNFCTYCIVPHSRGREVSYPVERIMKEIKEKEKQGFKEIVLTGIHIGHFKQGDLDLAGLVWKILKETDIPRVRLSSLEPQNFSDEFLKLLKEPRFCRHLHMSLQSGCDEILKKMNRKYDTKLFADVCKKIRKIAPETAVTTDVITGFPGETEKHHEESMKFAKEIGFAKLHVFPFSRRPKTPAYSMPNQVPTDVKRARADEFRKVGDKLREKFIRDQLGKEFPVLVEDHNAGWTNNYIKAKVPPGTPTNEIVCIKLTSKVLSFS
ncbi:MiaB/RimO family radical SAM methylthiotransferase, partial [Patescibacteria group bacterium]|nr:MiaB/RimO family radical SAM methylthiotransferase [Patescibacteria group bacterium]